MAAPQAFLSHSTPGRLRLSIPGRKGDARFFEEAGHRLAGFSEVIHAEGRPATGSLVIRHRGEVAGLARRAESEGLFALEAGPRDIAPAPTQPLPLSASLGNALDRADRWCEDRSGGRLDLTAALFLLLAGSAVVQALRGRIAAPAVTLGWYALNALLLTRLRNGSGSWNHRTSER